VCGGDRRQLLRQGLELFVLQRTSANRGEKETKRGLLGKGKKSIKAIKKDLRGRINLAIITCPSALLPSP
jgi:hypothetical protein